MAKFISGGFTGFFLKMSFFIILASCQEDLVLTTAKFQLPGELSLSNTPSSLTSETSFNVTVSSTDSSFISYKFKFGLSTNTSCSSAANYSSAQDIDEPIAIDTSDLDDGVFILCVLGIDKNGFEQNLSKAKSVTWTKDTAPPAVIISGNDAFYNLGKTVNISVSSSSPSDLVSYQYAIITNDLDCDAAIYSEDLSKNTSINDLLLGTSLNAFSSNSSTANTKLCIKTKDSSGNTAIGSVSWITDFGAPTITLGNTPDAVSSDNELAVSVSSVDEDFASIKYAVGWKDNLNCSSANYSTINSDQPISDELSDYDDGDLRLCVKALDSRGNESTPITYDWNMNRYKLSSGTDHACFIDRTNTLRCWGDNTYGRVGPIAGSPIKSPTVIHAGVKYQEVATFAHTTCAITLEGVLKCWGNNNGHFGQPSPSTSQNPVTVDSGVLYKKVSIGYEHVCGIKKLDNRLRCWGKNSNGQLGTGTTSSSISSPIYVDGTTSYLSISASTSHTCGVTTQGVLKCWGLSSNGQAGPAQNANNRTLSPYIFTTLSNVKEVYTTTSFSCALTNPGEIWCWGANTNGTLGNGLYTPSSTPVKSGSDFQSAFLHTSRACGIKTNGDLWCWGWNTHNLISTINAFSSFPNPVLTHGNKGFLVGAAGNFNICALNTQRELLCWGQTNDGMLAQGTIAITLTAPTVVLSPISPAIPTGIVYTNDVSITFSVDDADKVKGFEATHYKYKIDPYCYGQSGYSTLRSVSEPILEDVSDLPDGNVVLCIIAFNENGNPSSFKDYTWMKITDGILSISEGEVNPLQAVNFGKVAVDGSTTTSDINGARKTITLRNVGPQTVTNITPSFSGQPNFRYAIDPYGFDEYNNPLYPDPTYPGVGGTCGTSLGAFQTCSLVLEYYPTHDSTVTENATLTLNYVDSSSLAKNLSLNLSGIRAMYGCMDQNYQEYRSYYNIGDSSCATYVPTCPDGITLNADRNACEVCIGENKHFYYDNGQPTCVSTQCSGMYEQFSYNSHSCISTYCDSYNGLSWNPGSEQCQSICTDPNTMWDGMSSCVCTSGFVRNPNGECVSTSCTSPVVFNYSDYSCSSCEYGYFWNSQRRECLSPYNCPAGTTWNDAQVDCVSNCPSSQFFDGTTCQCPSGTTWDATYNSCVPSYGGCSGSPDC
jgi:alpha-tubulin suppressor-like RCC1 family protein